MRMKTRQDGVIILFFIFLAFLWFGFLKLNQLIVCGPQQFFVTYPLLANWLSGFFNGDIPWVTHAVAGGIPMWADPNLAILYPGNLAFLILPFQIAWNTSLVFHLFWGPCGLYWLCRKLGLPVSAALTGFFVFLFSTPLLAALNSNEVLISASWIPWIAGLTFFGLQQSYRKTLVAAIVLACQLLAGFTYVQAMTCFLVAGIALALYWQLRSNLILWRFLLLVLAVISLTAVQWFPSLVWLPHSGTDSFFSEPGPKMFPYLGGFAAILFVFGFQKKILWFSPVVMLIDYLWFGGSPFLSFVFAFGAAYGAAWILRTYPKFLKYLLPFVVAIELLLVNWNIPQLLPEKQLIQPPTILQAIHDFNRWNIHQSGVRGALSPVAGLLWGMKYGTAPESGLMLWKPIEARSAAIEDRLRTGKSLQLLRDAGIAYVLSDVRFHHPELGLVSQKSTKFYVHRLRQPVSPLVVSANGPRHIRWSENSNNSIHLTSSDENVSVITIHRNALPGWHCKIEDQTLPVHADGNGWITIQVPAGTQELELSYRPPGVIAGTILTLIGTILILAYLLL
jgi:hypothetical protein